MKNIYLIIVCFYIISMLTLPLLSIKGNAATNPPDNPTPQSEAIKTEDSVALLNSEDNTVTSLSMRDYLLCVVASEISLSSEGEAIKAQAVAAYTYTLYKKELNKDKNYDISDNYKTDQAYTPLDTLKEKWGDKAEENMNFLYGILDEVEGIYIAHGGKPILAAFHAISSGKTDSCLDVWGSDLPYLVAKESIGDILSPDYLSTVSVSKDDFKNAFLEKCTLGDDINSYIGDISRAETGTVKSITVGGETLDGQEFRRLLSLRSANFDVKCENDTFIFNVRGYGHGVGLSQCGANYMAKQGSNYKEILYWYYTGCELIEKK